MWMKAYQDYPLDEPLVKEQVQAGHGIVGCEMHEINGWGNSLHIPAENKKPGFFSRLLSKFVRSKK